MPKVLQNFSKNILYYLCHRFGNVYTNYLDTEFFEFRRISQPFEKLICYAKYLVLYKLSAMWLFDDFCNFIELLLLLSVSSFLDHNVFSEQSDRFDSMSQHFPAQNNEIYDKKMILKNITSTKVEISSNILAS